ncbi:hypothetical protein AAMO2058_000396600 [Amorphochlora amoebiformis]
MAPAMALICVFLSIGGEGRLYDGVNQVLESKIGAPEKKPGGRGGDASGTAMCLNSCNNRGTCQANTALVLKTNPNSTTFVHPYYCKCKNGWVGDDCSTRVDSLLGFYLSEGKQPLPPCCGVCGAQYDIPQDWSTMSSDLNPFSEDRCNRFGWFQKWDSDHGYARATAPDGITKEEKECFDRFKGRHKAFYNRRGLRSTPWLDFGSNIREMEGAPILAYEDYDAFIELSRNFPETLSPSLSLLEFQSKPQPAKNKGIKEFSEKKRVISAHWVHHTEAGGRLSLVEVNSAIRRARTADGENLEEKENLDTREGDEKFKSQEAEEVKSQGAEEVESPGVEEVKSQGVEEVKSQGVEEVKRVGISPNEHPKLWESLMSRFREKIEFGPFKSLGKLLGGLFSKKPNDFPCCVYCSPNATDIAEHDPTAGYDPKTNHKIRRQRNGWWKSPSIIPSNYAQNRSRGSCCEVCPGVTVGPHYYTHSALEDFRNDTKYYSQFPYLALMEEEAEIWHSDDIALLEEATNQPRKYDFKTDWKAWDESNPHLQRRMKRQHRRPPVPNGELPRSFARPWRPANDRLPAWARGKRRYRHSPCLMAEQFQLRASKDICKARGSCCNICPSQFWLQTKTSGYVDSPFAVENKIKHDEMGWFVQRKGETQTPRPVPKSETQPSKT